MALDPLITAFDLSGRLGRALTTEETTKSEPLMRDASAAVRLFTRQQFTRVTDDVASLPVTGGKVRLPQRPADRPTVISYRDSLSDVEYGMSGWTFDGYDQVDLSYRGYIGNVSSRWGMSIVRVTVTYSHGYEEIPEDVVGVVAGATLRALIGPALAATGLRGETIGAYSYQMQDGYTPGLVSLSADEKATLEPYRRRTGTTALR